ncbi:MAG TPA: TetR family transcriptional regulator [Pseudonocardiaceae bacterium]
MTTKSEQTRALVLETALRLFREQGYDRTTMRAIATEAGISVGNAYYYFASKEQLIQGFYDEIHVRHLDAAGPVLRGEPEFGSRLRGVLLEWLRIAEPYHEFATQFFKNAADSASPLSPFSSDSQPTRDATIELMRQVIDGSTLKLDPSLRADLPQLLWLYHMGIVLFWVHDRSAEQAKTRLLIERTVPLLARLLGLSRLRVFKSVTSEAVGLLRDLGLPDGVR